MKIFSCYSCGKEFKNSRSLTLNITRYKSHSSAPSTARSQVNNFKDSDSSISKGSSTATVTKPAAARITPTLVKLNTLIGKLYKKFSYKKREFKTKITIWFVPKYSTGIAGIETKLEKVTEAVRAYISQETVFLRIWFMILF